MRVMLDMPIFASPNEAWGNAEGEVEILSLPEDNSWLELPIQSDALARLGVPSSMLVWTTFSLGGGRTGILLDGAVAAGRAGAARIAHILEHEFGFDIYEYE